jgi:outer membrane receptor protein involved in Fe transport
MNHNSVADYKMQQALNGLTSDGKGNLSWNPATPLAQRVYFNWFGYNDSSFTRFLASDNPTSASLEYENLDFQASGTLLHLPAGPLGIAFGGEHRNEKLAVVESDLNQSGNIIGGAQSSSSFGSRQVNSLYAELNIPVFKWPEFLGAGRFEKYSDKDFAQTVHPKFGFKIRPFDWLILRGSYSQSFKAPDLAYLYSGATTTFTSNSYVDPVTGEKNQIQIQTSGNPLLKPETTDTYYAGFTLEPSKGLLKGLSASVDYFDMKQKSLLAQLTDFYTYTDYLNKAKAGDPTFAPSVVRDPITQQLLYIANNYSNLGDAEYKGWDFELAYVFTSNIGRVRASVSGTYIKSYTLNGSEIAGTSLNARFNGNAGVTWSLHRWSTSLFAVYRGVRHSNFDLGTLESGDELYLEYDIKPQVTVNASVSYDAPWNSKVTVGVDNVFNTPPPIDPTSQTGGTDGINAIEPAFWFVRLEKHF